jgi:hypothetical protein
MSKKCLGQYFDDNSSSKASNTIKSVANSPFLSGIECILTILLGKPPEIPLMFGCVNPRLALSNWNHFLVTPKATDLSKQLRPCAHLLFRISSRQLIRCSSRSDSVYIGNTRLRIYIAVVRSSTIST